MHEYGGAGLSMEGNAQTYSPFFFKLEGLAAEAEDADYHPLARVRDQVHLLFSVGEIAPWRGCSSNRRTWCGRQSGPRKKPPAGFDDDRGPCPLTPPAQSP